jgi:SH3-like domain-containing protein
MHVKYIISIFAILLFIQCQKKTDTQVIIESVRKEFVPDFRTGIFSITATEKAAEITLKGETDNIAAYNALLKNFKDKGYNIEDSIKLLPFELDEPWALVTASVANMRISPSHDAEMVTQALMGTPLKILKRDHDWLLVQTPDKYLSWIEEDVVQQLSAERFTKWQGSKKAIVTEWFEFLRDSVNQVVCNVTAGCILEIASETKDEFILSTADGRKGRLAKKSVLDFKIWKESTDPINENILKTAKTFMGTTYLWGGTSIKGVDCSGFVKTVYFLNGVILARDASQQVLYGQEVPINNEFDFNPGDLVFFGRSAKDGKPERVTHVGLYLGDSEFIHSSGMVKVNSFDSTRVNFSRYRTISLLKTRRIIGSLDSEGIQSVRNHPWY